jgi:arylsulfatase A-like enzyme
MRPPNLLFIYTDEQRADTLACYGNDRIRMPHLNRFAETATVVERAYVTQPVCTPSRTSLLTGLTPHTACMPGNNLTLPDEVPCLPEMLRDGYATAHHGKWHLGDEIFAQHGFQEWVATEDTYHNFYGPGRDQSERSAYHHFLIEQGIAYKPRTDLPEWIAARFFREQIHRLPEPLSRPAFLGREASRYIREHRDEPFALYVNFLEPHMPFYSCRDAQYAPGEVTLPANAMHAMDETYPRRARRAADKYREKGFEIDGPLNSEDAWRTLTARYWGMCGLVDTYIGEILNTLNACGLDDNTIVVLTSDHGDMMSSHSLLGKGYMFEESVRVPLLVRLPNQREQRRISGPFSHVDLVPTLLEAMGQPVPGHLEGVSRAGLLDAGGAVTDDAFIEWHGKGEGKGDDPVGSESIRTVVSGDGWKLNVSDIGEHELYHVQSDPCEYANRVADPALADLRADLLGRIAAWQSRTGDTAMALPGIV